VVFITGLAFLHEGIGGHRAGTSVIAARMSMSSRAAAGSPGAPALGTGAAGGVAAGIRPARGALPCGDALAGEHAKGEGERFGACVQGGVTQLLVAGIQPGTGDGDLAGIRAGARFSSRVAR
jgi:hypothetical protein